MRSIVTRSIGNQFEKRQAKSNEGDNTQIDIFHLGLLGFAEDVLLDEVIEVVEVATLANSIVVVTVRQFFPDSSLRFTKSE